MKRLILGLAVMFGGLGTATAEGVSVVSDLDLGPHTTAEVGTFVGTTTGYIVVDPPSPEASVAHFSRILFLNRCVGGCTISPGSDNSSTNRSSIVPGTRTFAAYKYGDASWNQLVACVQEIFAPFDVTVTTTDPGNTEHMEEIVAGLHWQSNNILGVAPFACGYIPRSISFTFANIFDQYYGPSAIVNEICAAIGQEVAHTWGLDHEMLASDPMTYLNYNGRRQYQNQAAPCGESQNRSCNCGGSTQNSYQEIRAIFGSSTPTPPQMTITNPANGAQVAPGFPVHATANEALLRAVLYVDNQLVQTITNPPYTFNAPATLGEGTHRVEVRGYDTQDTPGSAFVDVIIGDPCVTPGDCSAQGENYTCVGGRCVPGDGVPGGLGTPCTGDPDCFSGTCLNDGTDQLCVESCNPDAGGCPGGYDCIPYSGSGVCWPGDGDGGTCASTGGAGSSGNSTMPIALGLVFTGLVLRRRRRA